MLDKEVMLKKLREMSPDEVANMVYGALNEAGYEIDPNLTEILFSGLSHTDFSDCEDLSFSFSATYKSRSAVEYVDAKINQVVSYQINTTKSRCMINLSESEYIPAA